MFEGLFRDREHVAHAYVIESEIDSVREALQAHIQEVLGIDTRANPNVFFKEYDRLGIDEVRSLGELQSKTSIGKDGYKVFIVSFSSVTVEAQNAMLKILEEPTEGTIWLVVTPAVRSLLPTVLSRVQYVSAGEGAHKYRDTALEFVGSDYTTREKLLKQFAGDSKKGITADRAGLADLLREIMSILLERKEEIEGWTPIYRELEELSGYATDRSSSVKHIGDYVAIRLPQVDSK